MADLAVVKPGLLERHGLSELHLCDRDLVVRGRDVLPRGHVVLPRLDQALPRFVAVDLSESQPAPQERLQAVQLALMSPA